MKNNDSFSFDINDNFEDIPSSSKKSDGFEDITSHSANGSHSQNKNVNLNAFSDYQGEVYYYSTRKRTFKQRMSDRYFKIRKWWKCMKKGKRAAIITLTSLVLILTSLLVWFFTYFNYNYKQITGNHEELGFDNVINKKVVNIALFGLDSRDTENEKSFKGNSDSIMILSINTETKKVKIISVMRDTLAKIDRTGKPKYYKINAAYSWGGPELAIKTLNQNFGLDISEYATVNFFGMAEIIDAVGGIDVTVTDDELKWKGHDNPNLNNCMDEICTAKGLDAKKYYITVSGTQHMNGVQAVAYARIRHCKSVWGTNDDYGRTDRQRYVMEQLFNKATTMSKTQYVKLAKALIPCTETSLSYSEIMGIAFNVMFSSPKFEQYRMPQTENGINFLMPSPKGSFGSVLYYDLDYASEVIHAIIYDDMTIEDYVAQNGIDKNDWYAKAVGGSTNNTSHTSSSTPQTTSSETPSSSSESMTSSEDDVSSSEVTSSSENPSKPDDGNTSSDDNPPEPIDVDEDE